MAATLFASSYNRIVVLPFKNLGSPGPEASSFAKGLAAEIAENLNSLTPLKVTSRKSTSSRQESHLEMAREQKARYLVEGTVQWDGGAVEQHRVRIWVRLIRTTDYTEIWSGTFDREVEDIYAAQSEVSQQVGKQLNIALNQQMLQALEAAREACGEKQRDQFFYPWILSSPRALQYAYSLKPKIAKLIRDIEGPAALTPLRVGLKSVRSHSDQSIL